MKTWDALIIGAGIIGLSLARSLRKQGLRVLIIERGEAGREASYAAAGMLVPAGPEIPEALRDFAEASANLYPEFVHELEDESGLKVDFSDNGTILLSAGDSLPLNAKKLTLQQLTELEPELDLERIARDKMFGGFIAERSVDPRSLVAAAIKAAQHREVDIVSGSEVKSLLIDRDAVTGVQTERSSYSAAVVVNCAGAWAGGVGPHRFPVLPVKGQMLAMVHSPALRHVVRTDEVYVVPRADRRLVIGSTLENDGFNKRVDVDTIKRLFEAARSFLPSLANAKQHDAWAGLRPRTPDGLPILGATPTRGYFVATGHYRDGILLAPVTAQAMNAVILGQPCGWNLASFAPSRFTYKVA